MASDAAKQRGKDPTPSIRRACSQKGRVYRKPLSSACGKLGETKWYFHVYIIRGAVGSNSKENLPPRRSRLGFESSQSRGEFSPCLSPAEDLTLQLWTDGECYCPDVRSDKFKHRDSNGKDRLCSYDRLRIHFLLKL